MNKRPASVALLAPAAGLLLVVINKILRNARLPPRFFLTKEANGGIISVYLNDKAPLAQRGDTYGSNQKEKEKTVVPSSTPRLPFFVRMGDVLVYPLGLPYQG
jgi:hypothetical protein